MTRRRRAWIAGLSCLLVAVALAGGGFLVLATADPLLALSLPFPFSAFVHYEPSPCLVLLRADDTVGRRAVADALSGFAASHGFRTRDQVDDLASKSYVEVSYEGPSDTMLLASVLSSGLTVQLFKEGRDPRDHGREVEDVARALEAVGMRREACPPS